MEFIHCAVKLLGINLTPSGFHSGISSKLCDDFGPHHCSDTLLSVLIPSLLVLSTLEPGLASSNASFRIIPPALRWCFSSSICIDLTHTQISVNSWRLIKGSILQISEFPLYATSFCLLCKSSSQWLPQASRFVYSTQKFHQVLLTFPPFRIIWELSPGSKLALGGLPHLSPLSMVHCSELLEYLLAGG